MKPARGCPGRWQERPGDWVSGLECVELAGIPAEETFLWGLNPEWPADGNYEQRSARRRSWYSTLEKPWHFPGEQHIVWPLNTDLVFIDTQYLLNTYYVSKTDYR